MIKKIFLIVVPVICLTIVLFMFGINTYNSKYKVFQSDGHIIAKNSKSSTTKYFFDTETKYKTIDNNVVINSDDKEENITIPTDTFIHYAQGSISTFAKTVVLDLDDLNKENYKYYNIFSETIFVKNGNTYSVNYLDKKLNFTNFLLKINNEKFMIVGQKLKLTIGDVEKTFDNTYLEISYLDGNVIKIENQGVSYQSVSDQVMIEVGSNTIVDFVGKNIYKDREKKLALGEITIDSDDNIEINAEENKSITGNKDDNPENVEESNQVVSTPKPKKYTKDELPNISSGVVDTVGDNLEQIVDENARVKDAEFKVISLEVTANRLRATVQIVDEAAVLEGDINIKIIESNTNKVVYETNDDSGSNMIDIENETLTPETNYILVLNSDYKKNDVTYNKDFVQKTFITNAIGVSLEKYFISEDQIQVNLKKNSYSDVASVEIALEDSSEKTISSQVVTLDQENNVIDFTELTHDTNYKVRVYNFIYKDSVITDGFTILQSYETLKKKPTIGSLSFGIDKKESKFNMQINNSSDPDGGIISYKYEVYDARTIEDDVKPITTIEKNSNASASVKVDDKTVYRGVPYMFRIVMTFNDNEKEYDYVTDYSEVMKLDGVEFPTVRFDKDEVTFERIKGDIVITDDGNTIDINNGSLITITYTDSVGVSNSFTSSGTYKIPVDINNLRSNETYSFSVTATVDLQDGNPIIDSCFIGSVIVKTEDPKPFRAVFDIVDDPAYAFSLNAQLVRGNSGSTELEANTLTGISFNLYQGRNTSGNLVKTVKYVDRDLEPYSSELRSDYYDKQFSITPNFFGVRNSDLTAEYYTIQITGAYDYTTYKNVLPIEDNFISIKTSNFLPDMPSDPNNAVDVIEIRNREMTGDQKRADLYDSTIVGYRFRASYDNSQKYAKEIIYEIHSLDGKVVKTINYTVPVTGEINYVEAYVKDGLVPGQKDEELRRGQTYYITYTIKIDTDYDDNPDITYPLSGVLRSKNIEVYRQDPGFTFYPSKATNTTYSWKYTYQDVDHTLVDQTVTGNIDATSTGDVKLTLTKEYKEATFNLNTSGLFEIRGNYQYVDGKNPSSKSLTSQYYEGIRTIDFGQVAIYSEKNRVIFSFLDFANKQDLFNKISNVKIDFKAGGDVVTIDGLSAKTGNITINYSLIEKLMGKTITPEITLYYDSGIYGFDNDGNSFAIQQIRSNNNSPLYYYTFKDNKFNTVDSADGSYVTYKLDVAHQKLTITDKASNQGNEYDIFLSVFGLAYNSTYISPKKLTESKVTVSGSNTFEFDTIIPGISILNQSGLSSIVPLINSATARFITYGVEGQLEDNKIYVEVYQSADDTGNEASLLKTLDYDISNFSEITIDGLLPQTNYYLKVYGNVKLASGGFQKSYLYDVDQQRDGVNYYFKTIGNVGISDIDIKYSPVSYSNRRINIKYKLDKTIGYNYIKYNVYKLEDEGEVLLDTITSDNDIVFKESMSKFISIPNTSGFVTGETYVIEIQPVLTASVNGEDQDILLESKKANFKFNNLYRPYFSVIQSSAEGIINYRVNCRDYSRSIVDGLYEIQILDGEGQDVTPDTYKNRKFNISTVNQLFEFIGAKDKVQYTFNIIYDADLYNDIERIEQYISSYNSKVSTDNYDITLGSVYADTDMTDNSKINIRFFDSLKLTDAKILRYSIYDEVGYSTDNQVNFNPSLIDTGGTPYYQFQLPDRIAANGVYYISMQFLDLEENILAEITVEYRYLS